MHHCFPPVTRARHAPARPRQPAGRGVAGAAALLRPPAEPVLAADRRRDRARPRRRSLMRRGSRPCSTPASASGTRSPPRPARAASTPTSASMRRAISPRSRRRCRSSRPSPSTAAPRRRSAAGSSPASPGSPSSTCRRAARLMPASPFERKREAWLALARLSVSAPPGFDLGPGHVASDSRAGHGRRAGCRRCGGRSCGRCAIDVVRAGAGARDRPRSTGG